MLGIHSSGLVREHHLKTMDYNPSQVEEIPAGTCSVMEQCSEEGN
jgi:hypothetical protein